MAACFAQLETASRQGKYLAGFLSYEAGYAFEPVLQQKNEFDFPLLRFGVYEQPKNVAQTFLSRAKSRDRSAQSCRSKDLRPISSLELNLTFPAYCDKITAIQDHISAGDVYQITFCVKQRLQTALEPQELYNSLYNFQPVPYPAYLACPDFKILSLSPEMYLQKSGRKIVTRPMKGTLLRDGSLKNNLFGKRWLHNDPKNRAENIMITDLLRNDLGRICEPGSVKTTKLYEVAKYRTVFQMTSTVEGELSDQDIPFYNLFKATYPSGSVTGAPKIRAMEIIRELEPEERRIYTGTIGYIMPNRDLFFNIAIRTLLLSVISCSPDVRRDVLLVNGEMGVGGGITHYSTAADEYEECLIKSRFLL